MQEERDAALAHAANAEREAAAALKVRDTTNARARSTLERAAHERKAAAPEEEDDNRIPDAPPHTLQDAVLLHDAAAIINLHAQVVGVQNIHLLVPILLDLQSSNFSR